MEILDGKKISAEIKAEIKAEVEKIKAEGRRAPHLAAVLVGDNGASVTYVNSKVRSCEEVGFDSTLIKFPDTVSQKELLDKIAELNDDPAIDGFIVQLPLPAHIDEKLVTESISPDKDVDGFHPVNMGRLALGQGRLVPATPAGIIELISRYGIATRGKNAVVIGRSNMVKDGAAVIDVGITRVPDASKKSGFALKGDVDYQNVAPKCSYITPVPGGVGPMTIAMLMKNTLTAMKLREVHGSKKK